MTFSTQDNLNWDVITAPLTASVDGKTAKVTHKVAQLRDDTYEVIGVTGSSYEVFQNSSLKEFVNPLVEEGLLEITNIGYLGNGGKVFIQAQMTEAYQMAGEDHKAQISLLNAHDGSAALAAGVTDTRVVCSNTFAMAMADMSSRLRHSRGIADKAVRISEVVNYVNDQMRQYAEAVEVLASTKATDQMVDKVISGAYGKDVKSIRAASDIRALYRNGKGNEGRTLYDAVNGVTEYTTHVAGKDANKRFVSVNFGRNAEVNKKAFKTALALV